MRIIELGILPKVIVMRRILLLTAAALGLTLPTPGIAAPVAPNPPATGRALLLVPLTLTKVDDLDFGTVVPSGSTGAVSINATTGARTTIGGVTGRNGASHDGILARKARV